MSELHYWPDSGQPGEYTVELANGSTLDWYWNGDAWTRGSVVRSKNDMTDRCYLGVRREKPDPEQVDYYWPDTSGPHVLETKGGGEFAWVLEYHTLGGVTKQVWRCGVMCESRESLIERGYLGVKNPSEPVPAGVQSRTDRNCYWPDVPGKYTVLYRTGCGNVEAQDVERTASGWIVGRDAKPATNDEMERHGFIGVQKPPVAVNVPDNAAIAAQALAELRLCRKPFQTERWAYEWGPKLCQMLGAE